MRDIFQRYTVWNFFSAKLKTGPPTVKMLDLFKHKTSKKQDYKEFHRLTCFQINQHSRPQRPRSFWSATEVHDSRTSRHSAHAQSQIDWDYETNSLRVLRKSGQRSRFLVLAKTSAPFGDGNGKRVVGYSSGISNQCTPRKPLASNF